MQEKFAIVRETNSKNVDDIVNLNHFNSDFKYMASDFAAIFHHSTQQFLAHNSRMNLTDV